MKARLSRMQGLSVLAGLLALGLGASALAGPAPGACPNRRAFDHIGNFNFTVDVSGVNAGYFAALDVGKVTGVLPAKAASTLGAGAAQVALKIGKGEGFARWAGARSQRVPELVIEAVDAKGASLSRTRLVGCTAQAEGDTLKLSNCRKP